VPARFKSRTRILRDTCGFLRANDRQISRLLRYRGSEVKLSVPSSPIAHVPIVLCVPLASREAMGRASNTFMLVLVRDRKQMGVKRDPVACP
jgi:hypothetical protein